MGRFRNSVRVCAVGLATLLGAVGLAGVAVVSQTSPAAAVAPKVLILAPSVTAPAPDGNPKSLEQQQAEADGFAVDVVTTLQWQAMTASQFRAYQALIIGDPNCDSSVGTFPYGADANQSVWEPVVMGSGGNKVLIGTDPTFHNYAGGGGGIGGGAALEKNGIAFAGANAGATGAYIDLSCAYHFAAPSTPVPLLDGLTGQGPGQFTVTDVPCTGAISIIAKSGPTAGLTDANLSDWGCSVHEAFDKFPSDYLPLAIATDPSVPKTVTGIDQDTGAAVSGSPYIMVSGAT